MSLKDTKIIIKEGGGSPSTLKKKKKEEEKKEKVVAVIKTDTPASSNKTLKEVLKEKEGNNAARLREGDRGAVEGVGNRAASNTGKTSATANRQFTYDDYLNVKAIEKAEEMLNYYSKTGKAPSYLSENTKTELARYGISTDADTDSRQATPTTVSRGAQNTDNKLPSVTEVTSPLKREAIEKTDYSAPDADWRRPETFKAIPWEEYDKLGKTDRTAYLKAYAENSQREKQKRDEEAQAQTMQERIEASNKMLREKFYDQMIEGKVPLDLKGLSPDTVKYLEQRAYDDLSSGRISQSKYDFLPIHTYQGIDNKRQKLYNEGTNTTAQPHLQTAGFDRYRTERYDYVPANYVGNKKPSFEGNGDLIKYDREAAAAYGRQYGESYNFPEYMPMDNLLFSAYHKLFFGAGTGYDCANFVSQCLAAGGIEKNDKWYYYHQLNTLAEPSSQPENPAVKFYYDADGKMSLLAHDYTFSPEWMRATPQFEYFSNPENGYTSKDPVIISSPEDISSAIEKYGIQKGDLLYWSRDGGKTVHHATIISEVGNGEIRYAGHTDFATTEDLSEKMKEKPYETMVIVLMNDYIG